MRTNIVLNPDLVREAMQYTQARTRKALVDEALRTFVQVRAQERRLQTYSERLRRLDARLGGVRLRTSPAELLREDRNRQ